MNEKTVSVLRCAFVASLVSATAFASLEMTPVTHDETAWS